MNIVKTAVSIIMFTIAVIVHIKKHFNKTEILSKYDVIDNTSIYKFINQALSNNYEENRNNR